LFLGDSVTLYPGDTYQISPQTNCVTFQWFPPQGLNDPYASNPIANPEVSTNYVVTGLTEWGCPARDSINIYVEGESVIAVPNAFHPGSTGNNATFKVIVKGEASLNYFRVYNRWGNMVFESKDMSKGWDGTYNGQPQPVGVFVYDVQAVTSKGTLINKHGNITLVR
jgi:gliding motility-associated-like protein